MMADSPPLKYHAFLSYDRRDKAWGEWLHAELEGYRVAKDFVGQDTPVGPVPKTLRPIFRDGGEFSARHSLNDQTSAALESSKFMIVLCSPHAAHNEYINEEVRRFKIMGRADRVIPVIIDGEPKHPERECFPPAVWFGRTGDREEPAAVDARPGTVSQDIIKQKVAAGLLGLAPDDVLRSSERARARRNRTVLVSVGFFIILAAIGSVALYGREQLLSAWQQLNLHEKLVRFGTE